MYLYCTHVVCAKQSNHADTPSARKWPPNENILGAHYSMQRNQQQLIEARGVESHLSFWCGPSLALPTSLTIAGLRRPAPRPRCALGGNHHSGRMDGDTVTDEGHRVEGEGLLTPASVVAVERPPKAWSLAKASGTRSRRT